MVKVGLTRGQLLNVKLLGVGLTIPPVDLTLFDTDWIVHGVEGLFAPREDIWHLGDANRDGLVNEEDFEILKAAWGSVPGDPNWNPDVDFNKDGVVDVFDMATINANWGLDKRGGKVTQMLATTFQSLLSGIVHPIATAVWNTAKSIMDKWVEGYYEETEE